MFYFSVIGFLFLLNLLAFNSIKCHKHDSDTHSERSAPVYEESEAFSQKESDVSNTGYDSVSAGSENIKAISDSEDYNPSEERFEKKYHKKGKLSVPHNEDNKHHKKSSFSDTSAENVDNKEYKNISNKKSKKYNKKAKRYAMEHNINIDESGNDWSLSTGALHSDSSTKITDTREMPGKVKRSPKPEEWEQINSNLKSDVKSEEIYEKKDNLKNDNKYGSKSEQRNGQKSDKYQKYSKKNQKKSSDRQKRNSNYFGFWS